MKKLVFALALVGFSSLAMAQTKKSPEQKAKMETKKAEMQEIVPDELAEKYKALVEKHTVK